MMTIIIIIAILYIIGSSDNNTVQTHASRQYKKRRYPSKKEMKRIRKARERAEMDAFEDMIMYCEVFMDD